MTANKAKKILFDYIGTGPEAEPVEFNEACRLGAEALQRVAGSRVGDFNEKLLPGETKDWK